LEKALILNLKINDMKKTFIKISMALFIGSLLFVSSCTKEDDHTGCNDPSGKGTNSTANERIQKMIKKLPLTKITELAGRYAKEKSKANGNITNRDGDGWNFSDPGGGTWNFSEEGGITYTSTTNTFYIPWSSFGSNSASGGTVVAGSSSLDMNYTFCFSSNEAAYGLNLYDLDSTNFSGLSIVIGVSGDFEALAEADTTTDLFDYFYGLAFYIVYDSPADGDYKVVSWLDGLSDLDIDSEKAFAFIFNFRDAKLCMSYSGNINVDGGNMNYDGKYLEIAGFFDEDGEFDWDDLSYSIVDGFGTMGCN